MMLSLVDSNGDICLVDIQDMVYLQMNGHEGLHFYTDNGIYKALTAAKDWAAFLQDKGFLQLDRGTIVNVKKVAAYNSELRVVTVTTSEGNVFLPVAEKVQRQIKKLLK
ncbi:LytTR family transcriptional regulator DNA-binding domain-containing protein [Cohnella boryungensis]|uniref:LytTR family transcriptional regulator DNA-binding domain-containing protein n=1 Tax=Cohnella boryungensis TaxID=768479 RepID=A0ABV8SAQ4_9BACL